MTQFPTPEDREEVAAIVLRQGVEWKYRSSNLVVGHTDDWTFLLPDQPGPLAALVVSGPKFMDLTQEQTESLRQHFESVDNYSPIPIFKP